MMIKINIRKADIKDVEQILKLNYDNSFVTSEGEDIFWPEEILNKCVENNDCLIYVAEKKDDKEIVGFIIAGIVKSMEKLHCENIFVKKQYRRQGIGTKLIDKILNQAKILKLRYVVSLTNTAKEFCKAIGFDEGYNFTWFDLNLKCE